jgi:hypothetical protein
MDLPLGCNLCNQLVLETTDHLFMNCPYAVAFLIILLTTFNLLYWNNISNGIMEGWWQGREVLTSSQRTLWDVVIAGGCWALWWERNRRVFSDQRKASTELGNAAEQDIRLWLQFY